MVALLLLLLLLLSPLFPVAAPPGDVVGRSKTLMGGGIQKILLLGVQLMLLFVVVVGVLICSLLLLRSIPSSSLHRRSERTATLRSSLRPHKTLIPGPNPHRGPKARRNIEVTNSRFWGVWSSETQVLIQVSKSWFWEFSPVLFGGVVELLFRSGSRVIQPGSLIQVPKSWFFRVII
jgi:hypothetical protein